MGDEEMVKETIFEDITCNLCGADDYTVKFRPTNTNYKPEEVFSASGSIMGTQQIVSCNTCGLVYVRPTIKSQVILESYRKSSDELYVSQAEAREKTFKSYLTLVQKYARNKGKILDVGAAAGFFLKVARENGWDVFGVELSKWLCEYGNSKFNLNIKPGTMKEACFPDSYFDVVTMWDVLEHVPDPSQELQETHRILKPGGILIINYPDIGAPMARIAGRKWWFLLSGHLYYFDRKSIHKILEKTGFAIIKSKMHFQGMELGHLAKMIGLYNAFFSKMCIKLFKLLHIDSISIKYYASQTNVITKRM